MDLNSSSLGKTTLYPETYDASLLFCLPRAAKRQELDITDPLPFFGVDIWNAYELSWLNDKGKPVIALATFVIPVESANLIESKSFKLYLNSFSQTLFSHINEVQRLLEKDLSLVCQAEVKVFLSSVQEFVQQKIAKFEGECIDDLDIEINDYTLQASYLSFTPSESVVEEKLVSHLLKSNCPVTGQPDWGSVQICYRGHALNRTRLLKYLVSFRQHTEFHEHCIERIFTDIWRQCHPEQLSVYARYTRRGGLDINPFRSSAQDWTLPNITVRLARQ